MNLRAKSSALWPRGQAIPLKSCMVMRVARPVQSRQSLLSLPPQWHSAGLRCGRDLESGTPHVVLQCHSKNCPCRGGLQGGKVRAIKATIKTRILQIVDNWFVLVPYVRGP